MSYATNSGLYVGDSLMGYGFDEYLTANVVYLEPDSAAGYGLTAGSPDPDIGARYTTLAAAKLSTTNFAILQGGVNDIKNYGATVSATETAWQAMIDEAIGDFGASNVFVVNIAPWKNHTAWTTTFQTYTDDVNAYLATRAGIDGFNLIDMYTALEGAADELATAYDSGDGLHPSDAGVTAQRETILASLESAGVLNLVDRVNTFKRWRGAVEPAESGASGNEFKRWRGAVEPAAPVSSAADALIGGVTRSVTRTLTRGVTEGWSWGA